MSPALSKHRRLLTVICLCWALAVGVCHFFEQRFSNAEGKACDWLMTNDGGRRSPQNPRIVYLALDEASKNLDTLFQGEIDNSRALQLMHQDFPWNREVYALIIERLVNAGASAVIFDMLFPAPRLGDKQFRAALDTFGDHVVIGTNLKDANEDADVEQTTTSKKPIHVLPTPQLIPPPGTHPWYGFVNVRVDEDQVVRRVMYRTTWLEFFKIPSDKGREELLSLPARGLEKAGLSDLIPITHEPVRPRFSEEFFPRSLHEIFVPNIWEAPPYRNGELFRNKIVLIGAAGNEAEDRLRTPFGNVLAPTIHLSAINAALNRDFLTETPEWLNVVLIAGMGALAWILGDRVRRPFVRLMLLGLLLAGYYGLAQVLFNANGLLLTLFSPLLTFGGAGLTWSAVEQVLDRVERQRMRKTFERYVSKDVVRELLDKQDSFLNVLGGVRRRITILFSDVRGFTAMTESADPEKLVALLNEYFNEMVEIVFANQGTLDKFIGDGLVAHWGGIGGEGARIDAVRAVTAAVQMRCALIRLNESWRKRGIQELSIGIGINHGEAIVGNLGCEAKMEVSIIGDAVNLASRLEGVTKTYHVDFCIGEEVAPLVRDEFILRSLDLIIVKGKKKPVEVFAVIAQREAGIAEPAWLAAHEEAMQLYRKGDFVAAQKVWERVLVMAPDDGVAKVFVERCTTLQKEKPDGDWKGVFEMTSK